MLAEDFKFLTIFIMANKITPITNVTAGVEQQQLGAVESPAQPNFPTIDKEAVDATIAALKQGKRILVAEAERQGILLAFASDVNRAINKKHVAKLIESVKKIGSFLTPIKVLTAEEYFAFYPERMLVAENKLIRKESPDCWRVLVTAEGQHRVTSESEMKRDKAYIPTLMAEHLDLSGLSPDEWMVEVNTQSVNWTSKDRSHYILAGLPAGEETNISIAAEWQSKYGMGERAAYAILNLDDLYNKSLQIEYMNSPEKGLPKALEGAKEKRERGKAILHAFEVGFRNFPRMLKNMAAINLAIEKYKGADDTSEEKEKVVKDIVLFFKSLDQDVAKKANETSTVVAKNSILKAEWEKVSEKFGSDILRKPLDDKAVLAEAEWEQTEADKDSKAHAQKQTRQNSDKKKTSNQGAPEFNN